MHTIWREQAQPMPNNVTTSNVTHSERPPFATATTTCSLATTDTHTVRISTHINTGLAAICLHGHTRLLFITEVTSESFSEVAYLIAMEREQVAWAVVTIV